MKILFLRRRRLGAGSLRGMTAFLNKLDQNPRTLPPKEMIGRDAGYVLNERLGRQHVADFLIRWGCTSETHFPAARQLNKSTAIQRVNNKKGFREILSREAPDIIPKTYFRIQDIPLNQRVIIRPSTHAQGRKLYVANGRKESERIIRQKELPSFYASELIEKEQEFRVYVVAGRVANVAEKIPEDKNAIAWNHAQGSVFQNVKWDNWNLAVIDVAIQAFNHSGLDFGGVDVMTDRRGRAYVIEINSAPSLPLNEDGSVSYRQRCMAAAFNYTLDLGRKDDGSWNIPPMPIRVMGWRDCIHPGVWRKENGKPVNGAT